MLYSLVPAESLWQSNKNGSKYRPSRSPDLYCRLQTLLNALCIYHNTYTSKKVILLLTSNSLSTLISYNRHPTATSPARLRLKPAAAAAASAALFNSSELPSLISLVRLGLERKSGAGTLPIGAIVGDRTRRAVGVLGPHLPLLGVLVDGAQPQRQEGVEEAVLHDGEVGERAVGDVSAVRDCVGQLALGGDVDCTTKKISATAVAQKKYYWGEGKEKKKKRRAIPC